jgi:hypothetical protein
MASDCSRRDLLKWTVGIAGAMALSRSAGRPDTSHASSRDWHDTRFLRLAPTTRSADGRVVLQSKAGVPYELNETGVFLWRLCNGERTGRMLAERLGEHAGIKPALAMHDTQVFLGDLCAAGLLRSA